MTIKPKLTAPQIAARTSSFSESVIREMAQLGDETRAVNLSQGLPDFEPPAEVIAAAVAAIQSGDNQYTFPFGSPEFRRAIADKSAQYNGILADPETEVTVTCGVSEAVMATIFALTDPGDEVIILEPWYENYLPVCEMAGVRPCFVTLLAPDYIFDYDELRQAFNTKTRLIIINTPHNPTGHVFSRNELSIIAELCQEFNVVAVTDEIYEHIFYGGHSHLSIGSLPGMHGRTVTISGLSKTYAVTGWRVGWAVAGPNLTGVIRKTHDYMTVCAPAPFQAAGIVALNQPVSYYETMRAEYTSRRTLLLTALNAAGFIFSEPQGAYYLMADFSAQEWNQDTYSGHGWTPDRAFAEYMAREIGVAVVPGSSFYKDAGEGTSRVRFNFAKHETTLLEATRRLEKLKWR